MGYIFRYSPKWTFSRVNGNAIAARPDLELSIQICHASYGIEILVTAVIGGEKMAKFYSLFLSPIFLPSAP